MPVTMVFFLFSVTEFSYLIRFEINKYSCSEYFDLFTIFLFFFLFLFFYFFFRSFFSSSNTLPLGRSGNNSSNNNNNNNNNHYNYSNNHSNINNGPGKNIVKNVYQDRTTSPSLPMISPITIENTPENSSRYASISWDD